MKKFISHRGNDNHEYKENTMDAILESLNKDYISGVEFDIRITKDNKIVVIHDMTISKVSDGYGFIKDMTLNELLKFNFGNKKHKSLISTLENVLSNIKSNKIIMIEIKHESLEYKTIVNEIYKIIKKFKYLNLYICSFNHKIIHSLKKKNKIIKVGLNLLLKNKIDNLNGIDFLCVNYLVLDEIDNSIETFIWTINTIKNYNKIKKHLNNKVFIVTDNAYKLKDV